ncbi:MAG TPA: hypothetical protein VGE09_15260, partial [Pseudoxanthomonas sp.]
MKLLCGGGNSPTAAFISPRPAIYRARLQFTLITGAAANNGFHGIGGQYARHNLLRYGGGDRSSIAS